MKKIVMIISAFSLVACSSDEETPSIAKISGAWEIETIHYQACTSGVCKDYDVVDFENSGLTFEIRSDSVFYYPFVNSPETVNEFKVISYSNGLLKLQNSGGIWDFQISEQHESSMKVTAIVPVPNNPDLVFNDVISLKK